MFGVLSDEIWKFYILQLVHKILMEHTYNSSYRSFLDRAVSTWVQISRVIQNRPASNQLQPHDSPSLKIKSKWDGRRVIQDTADLLISPPINRNWCSSKKHRQIALTMPFVYVFATNTPDGGKPVTWRSPPSLQLLFVRYMKWLI
jgi:hypothetical protein